MVKNIKFIYDRFIFFYRKLNIAFVFAFIAGYLNATSFVAFGGFVSHVSGHATAATLDYLEGQNKIALISLGALSCFIFGAALASVCIRNKTTRDGLGFLIVPVVLELLLILFVYVASLHFPKGHIAAHLEHPLYFLLLAMAMGIQNSMLRIGEVTFIRTTHMTGVATDVGSVIGHSFYLAISFLKKNFHRGQALNFSPCLGLIWEHWNERRLFFRFSLLVFFVGGAFLGSFTFLSIYFYALLIPISLLFLVILRLIIREFIYE